MASAKRAHHFSSEQDLLFRITDRGIEALVRSTEDALLASPNDPASRLRAIVRVHVLTHAEHQQGSFIGDPVGSRRAPPTRVTERTSGKR